MGPTAMVWLVVAAAWAQDDAGASPCPEVGPLLASAENDALSYFLADAKAGLAAAVDAWGCGPRAQPAGLERYFRVQGLLWFYDEDLDRAAGAFARARALGGDFPTDYGDEVKAVWDAAVPPEGEGATLELKGVTDADWLALDGVDAEGPAPRGMHLLQVGQDELARYARVLDVGGGGTLQVVVPAAAAPRPAPEPELVVEPEPEPVIEPSLPLVVVPPAGEGAEGRGPAEGAVVAAAWAPPLERVKGGRYVDGGGQDLRWHPDLTTLVDGDPDGARARRRFRSNPWAQGVALALTPALFYGSYLFAWDATTGHNLPSGASWGATTGLGVLGLGAVAWEVNLVLHRGKRRQQVVEASERLLGSGDR